MFEPSMKEVIWLAYWRGLAALVPVPARKSERLNGMIAPAG
jgi:hypothetical protein